MKLPKYLIISVLIQSSLYTAGRAPSSLYSENAVPELTRASMNPAVVTNATNVVAQMVIAAGSDDNPEQREKAIDNFFGSIAKLVNAALQGSNKRHFSEEEVIALVYKALQDPSVKRAILHKFFRLRKEKDRLLRYCKEERTY